MPRVIKFGSVEVKVGVGKLYVLFSSVVLTSNVPHETSHLPKNKRGGASHGEGSGIAARAERKLPFVPCADHGVPAGRTLQNSVEMAIKDM